MVEEELSKNLSVNVVKAEIVQHQPPNISKISLPDSLLGDKSFTMAYADNVGGVSYKLPVTTQRYFRYKSLEHGAPVFSEYVRFVTYTDEEVRKHAEFLTKDLKTLEEKAQQLLDFVHAGHVYSRVIEEDIDYVRYPLETMVERNGDCEDLSIEGAALMKSVDLDVALIRFSPEKEEQPGHVGLGVNGNFSGLYFNVNGKKYFYAETTGTDWLTKPSNWKIGEMPERYRKRKAEIYVVN